MSPLFKHDCVGCRYLGTGIIKALSQLPLDFYICSAISGLIEPLCRTLIARYGDEGSQYTSGGLFECVQLTRLDKVALFCGLELTAVEEKSLLRILAMLWRESNETILAYQEFSSSELQFGKGNVVFRKL